MLSKEENELLTRTGPGTPMGDLLRRYWMPALLSRSCPSPTARRCACGCWARTSSPSATATAGSGCSTRTARTAAPSCSSGATRSAACAASTTAGSSTSTASCVDMPTEPPESTFKDRVRITRLSLRGARRRRSGPTWARRAAEPPLPELEFALLPATHRFVSKSWQECNWLQAIEGGIDTAHFSFLHMPVAAGPAEADVAMSRSRRTGDRTRWMKARRSGPTFHVEGLDAALLIGAARRADGEDLYWR